MRIESRYLRNSLLPSPINHQLYAFPISDERDTISSNFPKMKKK